MWNIKSLFKREPIPLTVDNLLKVVTSIVHLPKNRTSQLRIELETVDIRYKNTTLIKYWSMAINCYVPWKYKDKIKRKLSRTFKQSI